MRFQLALEDISVDVDNLIEMLIILKYATITQIGQEPTFWPVVIHNLNNYLGAPRLMQLQRL